MKTNTAPTRFTPLMALVLIAGLVYGVSAPLGANAANPPAPWVGKQLDGKKCANPRPSPGGGPFDYLQRHTMMGKLNMIETAHFPPEVEQGIAGKTGRMMDDLDFVLRSFPNHHRALNTSVQYSMRFKKWPADEHGVPAECYLQRAMNYNPRDGVPYRLYGYYMHKKGRFPEALEANLKALQLYPNDAMLHYNTALLLVKMKRYDEAMTMARTLYDAGLTLPGLKNKLVAAGKWKPSAEELQKIKAYLDAQAELEAAKADPSEPQAEATPSAPAAASGALQPAAAQRTADADPEPATGQNTLQP